MEDGRRKSLPMRLLVYIGISTEDFEDEYSVLLFGVQVGLRRRQQKKYLTLHMQIPTCRGKKSCFFSHTAPHTSLRDRK